MWLGQNWFETCKESSKREKWQHYFVYEMGIEKGGVCIQRVSQPLLNCMHYNFMEALEAKYERMVKWLIMII